MCSLTNFQLYLNLKHSKWQLYLHKTQVSSIPHSKVVLTSLNDLHFTLFLPWLKFIWLCSSDLLSAVSVFHCKTTIKRAHILIPVVWYTFFSFKFCACMKSILVVLQVGTPLPPVYLGWSPHKVRWKYFHKVTEQANGRTRSKSTVLLWHSHTGTVVLLNLTTQISDSSCHSHTLCLPIAVDSQKQCTPQF